MLYSVYFNLFQYKNKEKILSQALGIKKKLFFFLTTIY